MRRRTLHRIGNIVSTALIGGIGSALLYLAYLWVAPPKYDTSYVLHIETELEYWSTKNEVVDVMESYMQSTTEYYNVSPLLILNLCDRYDVDVRMALAQGKVESHYGTQGLAAKTNSLWNVGAFDGKGKSEISKRYLYDHPNQSIKPYLKLLRKSYLGNSRTEQDLLYEFTSLGGSRYASNPRYEEELRIVWDEINSDYPMDSLLQRYRQLKVEMGR